MPTVIDVTPPPPSPNPAPCADIKSTLDAYIAAEKAALSGVSVRWGDRSLTRANLPEIRQGRQEWEAKLAKCMAGCGNRLGGMGVSLATLGDASGCGAAGDVEGAERQNWNRNCRPCN